MFDENLGYDPASPDSIEKYAKKLEDKTPAQMFRDVNERLG